MDALQEWLIQVIQAQAQEAGKQGEKDGCKSGELHGRALGREEIRKEFQDVVHPEFCKFQGEQFKECARCLIDRTLKHKER